MERLVDCSDKLKFNSKEAAEAEIRLQRSLGFKVKEEFGAYYCKKHSCWHNGHSSENYDDNSRAASINRTLNRIDEAEQERRNKNKNKR